MKPHIRRIKGLWRVVLSVSYHKPGGVVLNDQAWRWCRRMNSKMHPAPYN